MGCDLDYLCFHPFWAWWHYNPRSIPSLYNLAIINAHRQDKHHMLLNNLAPRHRSPHYRHPLPHLAPIQHNKPLQLNPQHNQIPPLHNPPLIPNPIPKNNNDPSFRSVDHKHVYICCVVRFENTIKM